VSIEPIADEGPARPNVSGDLPTVLQPAPMFRRTVAGYDRFQVDTYVRWAEDELAAADREREHLVTRSVRTQAALEEAQQLLAHSAGGAEFLRLSRRLGSMLATAADEAEDMRAEGETERAAAAAEARETITRAEQVLSDAEAGAARALAEVAVQVADRAAEADRLVAAAEQVGRDARAEADACVANARLVERQAVEQADQIRRQATLDAAAALANARHEVVRMLTTGREQRQRADAEAAALRERENRAALAVHDALVAEIAELRSRRTRLRAEVRRLSRPAVEPTDTRLDLHLPRLVERLRWSYRSLRAH
jgi:hypothetical protein